MAWRWMYHADRLSDVARHLDDQAIERIVADLEQFIPAAEASVRTGRRITEPYCPLKPRGLLKCQTELADARKALPIARALLETRRDELAASPVVTDVDTRESSRPATVIDLASWRRRRIERTTV